MALARVVLLGNALFQNVALEPALTGPLLYLFSKKPELFRQHVLRRYPRLENETILKTLKWLVALGVGRKLNDLLNRWALNNWQFTSKANWDWPEEIVVLTGGSSGFGEKVAEGLAKKGLKVVVLDIQGLPASLKQYSNISFYECNITDPSAVSSTANTIRSILGHPSILINNAGIAYGATILSGSNDSLRKLFDVNVLSHYYLIREFMPHMVASNKGHIVSVASMASYVSCSNIVDYCATKAAVLSLHEGLMQELKHRYAAPDVKTSVVHPLWANTSLVSDWESELKRSKTPLLSAEVVGNLIVKQVLSGRSGQVFVPPILAPASLVKGLPHWVGEYVRDGTAKATGQEVVK